MAVKEDRPILVVDDDAKIVRLVRAYLEREGYRVVGATDGRAALSAIELERPALVVLDLMLPEIDGLSVVRSIRAAADDTPVIILSARGTTADRISGLASGADDYLAKPFSPAELVLRVGRVLARARPTLDPVPGRLPGGAPPTGSSETIVHGDLVV
ncbi:MAG TPA: response regulator, partial [Candidatus Limnocylindrales bacterium]